MGSGYTVMPSSIGTKLLGCSNTAITTSLMDLATYVDVTGFESILVVLVSAKLAAETGTNVTMTALHSTASDGTGATSINDRDAAAFTINIGGSAAAGRACSMQLRCRGLKKYFSPGLLAVGATVTVTCAIYGIMPRDTGEVSGQWADEQGLPTAGTAFS